MLGQGTNPIAAALANMTIAPIGCALDPHNAATP
jgi:hypothetical protein